MKERFITLSIRSQRKRCVCAHSRGQPSDESLHTNLSHRIQVNRNWILKRFRNGRLQRFCIEKSRFRLARDKASRQFVDTFDFRHRISSSMPSSSQSFIPFSAHWKRQWCAFRFGIRVASSQMDAVTGFFKSRTKGAIQTRHDLSRWASIEKRPSANQEHRNTTNRNHHTSVGFYAFRGRHGAGEALGLQRTGHRNFYPGRQRSGRLPARHTDGWRAGKLSLSHQ